MQGKLDFNEINIDLIKTIAGIDVAYFKRDDIEYGVCCIDVFDIHTFEIIEKETYISEGGRPRQIPRWGSPCLPALSAPRSSPQ